MEGRGARFPACGGLHLRHRGEGRRGRSREGMEVGEGKAVGRRVRGSPRRSGGRSAWGRGLVQGVTRQGRGAGWGRYRRRWGGAEVGPRALGRGPDGGPSVSGVRAGRGGVAGGSALCGWEGGADGLRKAEERNRIWGDGGAQRGAGDGRERLGEVGAGGQAREAHWGGGGGQTCRRLGPVATGVPWGAPFLSLCR